METAIYEEISLKLAPLLHALSHPARVQIIIHLSRYKACQAGSISEKIPLAKSTISEHLSKLLEAQLINSLADGNHIYYSLNLKHFGLIKDSFIEFQKTIEQLHDKAKDCCPLIMNELEK
ncbi:MAG: winged helix-turn-helix transcriptional regulator [Salinivirgaceae bacterium]|nr:winged helix-turn-helix transcriptional regulator [Salinivirgaceae bacterium]